MRRRCKRAGAERRHAGLPMRVPASGATRFDMELKAYSKGSQSQDDARGDDALPLPGWGALRQGGEPGIGEEELRGQPVRRATSVWPEPVPRPSARAGQPLARGVGCPAGHPVSREMVHRGRHLLESCVRQQPLLFVGPRGLIRPRRRALHHTIRHTLRWLPCSTRVLVLLSAVFRSAGGCYGV